MYCHILVVVEILWLGHGTIDHESYVEEADQECLNINLYWMLIKFIIKS